MAQLTLTVYALVAPTQAGGVGSVRLAASGGTAPLTLTLLGTTAAGASYTSPAQQGPAGTYTFAVPAGTYTGYVYDGTSQYRQVAAVLHDGPPAGSTPLTLSPLPQLAAIGVPLPVTLTSTELPGATPTLGLVQIYLAGLGNTAGVVVMVDEYRFTSGPLIVPGRFTDAESLTAALLATPVLAARYAISYAGDVVRVQGRTAPGNAEGTTSDGAAATVVSTPGAPARYDQAAYRWGCFVEVWAGCGEVFGGPTDPTQAVRLLRLTADYDPAGLYTFDIAPALRQLTGHAYPRLGFYPDRLVSYFLRYGEEYADTPTGLRRVRNSTDSEVAWGLEAVTVPAPTQAGLHLLTARPAPWRLAGGDRVPCGVLLLPGPGAQLLARTRLATTRATTSLLLPKPVDNGRVQQGQRLNVPAGTLSGLLGLAFEQDILDPVAVEFTATGPALTFANRQGSTDTVRFAGTPDESGKRTGSTYQGPAGVQQLSADYQPTLRLYSGLLPFAEWDWLRQELAVSPAAWLEDGSKAPPAYTVADVVADADHATGTYSLYVDLQPPAVRGLSN